MLPPIPVVCAVIADPHGRFLAVRRPEGKALGGLWEFPGGKIEPGEDDHAALRREILEELGLTITVGNALSPVAHDTPTCRLLLKPYCCHITSGTLTLHEHSAALWLPPADLPSLPWAPADLPVIAALQANL